VLARLAAFVLVLLIGACSVLPREEFTEAEQNVAQAPGFPGVRFFADASTQELRGPVDRIQMSEAVRTTGRLNVLAISGGAYDGAFGAGVIAGWTKTGTRPQFAVVTGVSAGALIAPLAFLGPDYDGELEEAFTGGMAQILGDASILSLLGTADMRRQTLVEIIEKFVTPRLLAAIAREHAKGRRLLVVTTNLDAERGVVWNMGAIASSRNPEARQLFIDVLAASASIPGVFAPTFIGVEANGHRFKEMHVDGGATVQVFAIPEAFLAAGGKHAVSTPASIWVIANKKLTPEFEVTESGVLPVVGRAFASVIKTHTRFTLLATAEFARTHGIGFHLAAIAADFTAPAKAGFNTAYMQAVYRHGYDRALSGQVWTESVPLPGGKGDSHTGAMASAH
jgi:hypothetical protein